MEAYGEAPDPLEVVPPYANTLKTFFEPKSVAVVGATDRPGHIGRTVLSNMKGRAFKGNLYAVNPKREKVLNVPCFPTLDKIPEVPELVVIVTPSRTVPDIVGQCVDIGVASIIIISAGFKEVGEEGKKLEAEIEAHLSRSQNRTRVVGPNCLGIMRPDAGINATFASQMALDGNLAFLSQSGAMCTAVLDWSFDASVGFSHFVSVGSMLDVDWADLIDYLEEDKAVKSILIYMETVGNARGFLTAARQCSFVKPIIVLKAGRTAAAAAAAVSHTGSMAGSDDVLDAAFERAGVVRVNTVGDLFAVADLLSRQPVPQGPHLTMVTNAGGPGVLATDALIQSGGKLTELTPESMAALNEFLPKEWSHSNPVDMIGSATPSTYSRTLDVISRDTNTDGILVIMAPQGVNASTQTAAVIRLFAQDMYDSGKPILVAFTGGEEMAAGRSMILRAGVPCFPYADDACRMFAAMWWYRCNLQQATQTAALRMLDDRRAIPAREQVNGMIRDARYEKRTVMTEAESKQVLAAYDVPCVNTWIAATEDSAARAAEETGYPVVVKIHSEVITHKSDVGGVILGLNSADEVRQAFRTIRANVERKMGDIDPYFLGVTVQPMMNLSGAYELILGSHVDPQFGPVISFGTGGQMVEVICDVALALPPLNSILARNLIKKTKAYKALLGVRGRGPVDLVKLEEIVINFARLVTEHPEIREVDINPLVATEERIMAVDARVVLWDESVTSIPRVAIRPYPSQYITNTKDRDGTPVLVRPLRWEDKDALIQFHRELSDDSVIGYFGTNHSFEERTAHARLVKIAYADYSRVLSLVCEPAGDEHTLMGVVRVMPLFGTKACRFTMLVADPYQKRGLGRVLLDAAINVAREEGFSVMAYDQRALDSSPSAPMAKRLFKSMGFIIGELECFGRKRVYLKVL